MDGDGGRSEGAVIAGEEPDDLVGRRFWTFVGVVVVLAAVVRYLAVYVLGRVSVVVVGGDGFYYTFASATLADGDGFSTVRPDGTLLPDALHPVRCGPAPSRSSGSPGCRPSSTSAWPHPRSDS